MASFTGFLDQLGSALLSPKGNLGDYAHASKLFINENLKFAPKQKHLFHCFFQLNSAPASILPELEEKHKTEIGMLVKSADLPKYSAEAETKNKYNRKKTVLTSIRYEPITITFHDDSYGVTTALLEAYYRYQFADGNWKGDPGAYNKAGDGDNTYKNTKRNEYRYGLDNNQTIPFFNNIQISVLSRKAYTTYTLVNPTITSWQHDSVDHSDGGIMANTITVQYEAVFYDRGNITLGSNPKGFGEQTHYDVTPSSLNGGGLSSILGQAANVYGFITGGETTYKNPLQTILGAAQLISNVKNLSADGLRQEGINAVLSGISSAVPGGTNVSGVAQTLFPSSGNGSFNNIALATAGVLGASALASAAQGSNLANNPAALDSAMRQQFQQTYQASGGAGGVNESNAAYNALPASAKQAIQNQVLGT